MSAAQARCVHAGEDHHPVRAEVVAQLNRALLVKADQAKAAKTTRSAWISRWR